MSYNATVNFTISWTHVPASPYARIDVNVIGHSDTRAEIFVSPAWGVEGEYKVEVSMPGYGSADIDAAKLRLASLDKAIKLADRLAEILSVFDVDVFQAVDMLAGEQE